jgi:hypothetical protein
MFTREKLLEKLYSPGKNEEKVMRRKPLKTGDLVGKGLGRVME